MKNPNDRYADWDEVLHDIRHLLAGSTPSCVRPDDEFLSTIANDFDEDLEDLDSIAKDAPPHPPEPQREKQQDRRLSGPTAYRRARSQGSAQRPEPQCGLLGPPRLLAGPRLLVPGCLSV